MLVTVCKFMLRRFVVSLMGALLLAASAAAQSYKLSLQLKDALSGEPVGFATVSVAPEKGQHRYTLSDADGNATLEKLRSGKYTLKAEIMGYKTHQQEIRIADADLALGVVKLEQDLKVLDAASVTATGNPIIIKKDTVEYNASSYKISDDNVLEDLLKKLPGVEVAEDGSITAGGETITKLTIDGKTFFLDDPQLATKNIPAKLVEKVKVVEQKSEQARFTGIDDGEEETIIDLSFKKGMGNGVFGNVMAGGGHDLPEKGYYDGGDRTWQKEGWRWQGAAMVGNFTKTSQISAVLNANNTNNRGFNDISGNMLGNMRGERGMGRGQGGWGRGNGITTSYMGGLNGAWTLFDKRMDLSGNYLFNGSEKAIEEESEKITYLEGGQAYRYLTKGFNNTNTYGHRFGVRMDHKFTDKTSILFQPQFSFGTGNFREFSQDQTYKVDADVETEANKGFTHTDGSNRNYSAEGFLLFRQKIGEKAGRTISFMGRYSFSGNELDGFNQSLTKAVHTNQRYEMESNSASLHGRLVYTEPIAQHLFLEANYAYGWTRSTSDKDTWDSGTFSETNFDAFSTIGLDAVKGGRHPYYNPAGELPNETYSNSIVNRYVNQTIGANLFYQNGKTRLQLGASARPTDTWNETNGKTYESHVWNFSPQAMAFYDFNDNTNIRFFYFGRSAQPTTRQLMPVSDNSNPLNIRLGNPYLEPYFNHNIRGRFGYSNKKTFTSVNVMFGGGFVQDPIVSAMWYSEDGVQFSVPVNGPTSANANVRCVVNSPITRNRKLKIFSMTRANYSTTAAYIGDGPVLGGGGYYSAGEFDYVKFHQDYPDVGASDAFTCNRTQTFSLFQRLRFTYTLDNLQATFGGRTRINKSWYSVASYSKDLTFANQLQGTLNWTLPGGFAINGEANYNWYSGYSVKQEDEIILNAEITKSLFKKQFTLGLKAYDIMNQSKNLSVTDDANYHKETRNNTLGRYIILSLTYRFGNLAKARETMQSQRRGPRF